MPVIDVRIVTDDPAPPPAGRASALADAMGAVFGAAPGRVWVRLHTLPAACYAENDVTLNATELPVFVTVLHAQLPAPDALALQAAAITRAVATVTGRAAERVHVEFAPPGVDRMAFGGQLLRASA